MNVFIFPGQGAQFPGMGLEAYRSSDKIKSLFNQADEILGFKLSKVMFEGTEDELKQTKVTKLIVKSFCRYFSTKFILEKCPGAMFRIPAKKCYENVPLCPDPNSHF